MNELRRKLFAQIDAINKKVVTLRHDIHAHTELSEESK